MSECIDTGIKKATKNIKFELNKIIKHSDCICK